MLAKQENILKYIKSPKEKEQLILDNGILITTNHQERYSIVNGIPILLEKDNPLNESIKKKKLDSIVKRPSKKTTLKKVLFPPSKNNIKNIQTIQNLAYQEQERPKILIIGGGEIGNGLTPLYDDPNLEIIAFDIYLSDHINFLADAHQIPLASEFVDIVIIQAVLEHVLYPNQVISEIYRVLKKNGIVYAETPFLQQVHEGAYDFTRYTERGHRLLFKNFIEIESGYTNGIGTQFLWSIEHIFRGLFRSPKIGKIAKIIFFWIQYFDHIIPSKYNMDSASGVFFLGRKSTRPIKIEDFIKSYKGSQ